MDPGAARAYIPAMTIGTRLFTWLRGSLVGTDSAGNRYFTERRQRPGFRRRRWVLFAGPAEGSAVPPEWHPWLHYTTDAPLTAVPRRAWEKPHLPNMTGTPLGYRPSGSDYRGGRTAAATGDYEAWTPGS